MTSCLAPHVSHFGFHARRCTINLYLIIPLLTGLALAQTVLLSRVSLWGARPDLVLLAVVGWALVQGMEQALVWGVIGGLIVDLLSGGPLGATVLALLAAALLAGQPWGQGLGSPVIRMLFLAFASAVAYHGVLLIVLAWTGHTLDWTWALLRVVAPSALLNGVLIPFVNQPLAWLERQTRRERFAL